jgi:uncharacterized phiE125 gp8 family phage protein
MWRHHHHDRRQIRQVTVVEAPMTFMTVQELNARLRLDLSFDSPMSADDQEVMDDVQAMIESAISSFDGPTGSLGRCLAPQMLELSMAACGERSIELLFPPIIAVDLVTYLDGNGAEQTLDPTTYSLRRGAVWFTACAPRTEDLRIRYRAGYATADSPDVEAVPKAIRQAICLMVGDMWSFRESADAARVTAIESSATVDRLIAPYKLYSV